MPWRFHGHASPDATQPRAQGICDRCNFSWQLSQLSYQYEYRGSAMANTRFRVCPRCLDKVAVFKKVIVIPADPVPVQNPRPDQFAYQSSYNAPFYAWDTPGGMWDSQQGGGNETDWL